MWWVYEIQNNAKRFWDWTVYINDDRGTWNNKEQGKEMTCVKSDNQQWYQSEQYIMIMVIACMLSTHRQENDCVTGPTQEKIPLTVQHTPLMRCRKRGQNKWTNNVTRVIPIDQKMMQWHDEETHDMTTPWPSLMKSREPWQEQQESGRQHDQCRAK